MQIDYIVGQVCDKFKNEVHLRDSFGTHWTELNAPNSVAWPYVKVCDVYCL